MTNKQAVRSLDEELRFSKSEITFNHLFTYAYFNLVIPSQSANFKA